MNKFDKNVPCFLSAVWLNRLQDTRESFVKISKKNMWCQSCC